jgi:nitric oxide synthase oxygenase domain/subunit/hemoglobin-like flavoprotein
MMASDETGKKRSSKAQRYEQMRGSLYVKEEQIELSAKEMAAASRAKLRTYETPLQKPDVAMVMQGWNKVLAFKESFSEAMMIRWRLEIAFFDLQDEDTRYGDEDLHADSHLAKQAMDQVENNTDPLATAMAVRIHDLEDLIMRLLDAGVRSLCPHSQTVQREAYRPIEDLHLVEQARGEIGPLESITIDDIFRLFARRGVYPNYWFHFVQAFIWCMKTHVPYAQDDDREEFDKFGDNPFARAITQTVALPAIECFTKLMAFLRTDLFTIGVPRFWNRISEEAKAGFSEEFYKTLLQKNPDLLDYFSSTNMDALSFHLMATLGLLVKSIGDLGRSDTSFRNAVDDLGENHRKLGIPTFSYAIVGNHLLDCLDPLFEAEEQITKNDKYPVKASQLLKAWATLYTEVAALMHYPMLHQTNLVDQATEFYNTVGEELGWSSRKLKKRLLEITYEIASTWTYNQTTQEIETGARLAWRNSAKCIGRISWKTLEVRDKRHVTDAQEMFREVEEHLKLATAGTNIQSVMTIFPPKGPKQIFGTRFWSSQCVRYAAYKDLDESTLGLLGDPANLELTEYLIDKKLWTPPKLKTAFDVLPLVLKVPGKANPLVHKLPQAVIFEVPIEHPTRPEINALGYRWATVPAISNFKMNLGGVVYGNMPFNGWFMTTEIVRNLMERYDAGPAVAKVLDVDIATNPFWEQLATVELEVAVNSSFRKNGHTIVDPKTAGNQFCAHVRREREHFGRECPGQCGRI